MDGYHLTPDGIPVLVNAIHKAGAVQEQTGPHLVLSDSSLLGFTAQDARNSRTLMIIRTVWPLPYLKRRENLGFYDKSVVAGLRPALFEAHDEGSSAQKAVQKALGQGVLVHPVGGASFTDRRKFRNFLRIAQSVWFDTYPFQSLTLVWAGNDLGRCEPTELLAAVQALVEFASKWDVELRLVDVVGSRYHLL